MAQVSVNYFYKLILTVKLPAGKWGTTNVNCDIPWMTAENALANIAKTDKVGYEQMYTVCLVCSLI